MIQKNNDVQDMTIHRRMDTLGIFVLISYLGLSSAAGVHLGDLQQNLGRLTGVSPTDQTEFHGYEKWEKFEY